MVEKKATKKQLADFEYRSYPQGKMSKDAKKKYQEVMKKVGKKK